GLFDDAPHLRLVGQISGECQNLRAQRFELLHAANVAADLFVFAMRGEPLFPRLSLRELALPDKRQTSLETPSEILGHRCPGLFQSAEDEVDAALPQARRALGRRLQSDWLEMLHPTMRPAV